MCRDVWALHLALLPNPPPAEPYFHALEQYGEQTASPKRASSPEHAADGRQSDDKDDAARSEPSESSSSSSSSEDGEEEDPEMAKLLRENSEASSSDDAGTQETPNVEPPAKRRKRQRTQIHSGYDSPAGNLAVLMVACWSLRVPMMYKDFIG